MRFFICAVSILGLLTGPELRAQDSRTDSTYVLPEITVEDVRAPFYGNDLAAHVTSLRGIDFEATGDRTVAEVLDRHGGVFVRRYGPGGLGGVTLRGTGPAQTAVMLDGLPLVNPQIGQIDLSLLPASMLSGVDVLHGGASSLVGSSAMGGVISLRSAAVESKSGLRASAGFGAWGERRLSGRVALGGGRLRMVVSGELFGQVGDFSYRVPTLLAGGRRARENADVSSENVMARLVLAGTGSTLEVAGWLANVDRGLPGTAGQSSADRQSDALQRVWLRFTRSGTTLRASSQRSELSYVNPTLTIDDTGATTAHTLGVSQRKNLGRSTDVEVGVDASVQAAKHPSLARKRSQRSIRAFAAGSTRLGRWSLMPSVTSDWVFREGHSGGQVSPGVRIRFRPPVPFLTAIRSGLSSSFRLPTFNDLYWRSGGAIGNPDLLPERGLSADIGVEAKNSALSLDATAFFQHTRDRIEWLPDAGGVWSPTNIGRVRSLGLEMSATATFVVARSVAVRLNAAHTITDSRDKTDRSQPSFGQPLRYVPRHTVDMDASARWRSLELGITADRTGRRFVTTDASEWLDSYFVLAARLRGRVATDLGFIDATVFVENVGGAEYQVMSGYPMPPRHIRFQITLTTR